MSKRTFAEWVEPIAAQLAASRREVVEVARSVPEEKWGEASPLEGWAYHDLLSHLAAGDWAIQHVLSWLVKGTALDPSIVTRVNDINEENRRERAGRTAEELIAEAAAMGEETQNLLSGLKPDQEEMQVGTWKLNDLLQGFAGHDPTHLEQLRTALEVAA